MSRGLEKIEVELSVEKRGLRLSSFFTKKFLNVDQRRPHDS